MYQIKQDIEQLELACDLLRRNDTYGGRLALILIDNVIEGCLYRYAKYVVDYERYFEKELGQHSNPRFSETDRKSFLWYFGPKVDLAKTDKYITPNEACFLKKLHEYRNDNYHHIQFHAHIVNDLARLHLTHVCDLYNKFIRRVDNMPAGETFFKARGFKESGFSLVNELPAYFKTMSNGLAECTENIATKLSENLTRRIKRLQELIEGFIQDRDEFTPDTFLKEAQWWALEMPSQPTGTAEEFIRRLDELEMHRQEYKHPITWKKLQQMVASVKRIKGEKDSGALLDRYGKLEETVNKIDDNVHSLIVGIEETENQ